jgi:hypothetical protein
VCARVLRLTAIAYPRIKPSKHALKAPSHTGCDFREAAGVFPVNELNHWTKSSAISLVNHLALLKSRGIYVGLAAVEVVGMKEGLV